jgi:hypothetical protein
MRQRWPRPLARLQDRLRASDPAFSRLRLPSRAMLPLAVNVVLLLGFSRLREVPFAAYGGARHAGVAARSPGSAFYHPRRNEGPIGGESLSQALSIATEKNIVRPHGCEISPAQGSGMWRKHCPRITLQNERRGGALFGPAVISHKNKNLHNTSP